MIRILQLPGNLTRDNGRMTVIMNVYRQIDRTKFQFDFAGTGNTDCDEIDNELVDEIKSLGGRVFLLKKTSISSARSFIKELLTSNPYEIVHYHQLSVFGMTLDILKKQGVKKIIVHSHSNVMSETKWKIPRNRLFSIPIYLFSNQNVAVSEEAGKNLFLSKNFKYIPNAINVDKYKFDLEARKEIRRKIGIDNSNYLIGTIGRFSKQKNQPFLIPVIQKLISLNDKYHFIFIGSGSQEFERLIKNNNLETYVTILDSTPEIEKYYSAMDLFVLPSLFEGLGLVAVEAQANGLSTIVTKRSPKVVEITNTEFISVKSNKKNMQQWVDSILSEPSRVSENIVQNKFKESGFLIKDTVSMWEELYLLDGIEVN